MENKRIDLGNGYFAEPDTTAHKDGMDLYNLFDEEAVSYTHLRAHET